MEQAVDGWGEKFGLSAREKEVAQLLLSGRNVPAVADLLCISQSTVQTHVKHIYERTGVHSRQELIALGHESLDELLSEQRK
ncbi:response regulator transcription factor [Adlercreutzia sp. ZJ138]|uniref:response regulator transcription factor n=1 Tax=Adlercreutzia sp. ZJ138 TaxID=2709405 RepID=UPI00351BCF25